MAHHYGYGVGDGTNVNMAILVKDCILPVPLNLQCPLHLNIICLSLSTFFLFNVSSIYFMLAVLMAPAKLTNLRYVLDLFFL